MTLHLPPLPFGRNALEPVMSAETLKFHHDKHHAGYVKKYNDAVEGTPYAKLPLEDAVRRAHERGDTDVFNNGAQAYNHAFFWESLAPKGESGKPHDALLAAIKKAFESLDGFRAAFVACGSGHFASGWVWLAAEKKGALRIVDTPDGEPVFLRGLTPLLVCDLWEHAYYIDYRNDRDGFLKKIVKNHLSWAGACARYDALMAKD